MSRYVTCGSAHTGNSGSISGSSRSTVGREALSKAQAQTLRDSLRTSYFHTGGRVLSSSTRQDYFNMLDALELVIGRHENIVSDQGDEFLRVLGSRFRTAMTRDVGTRRTFIFRGDPEREERGFRSEYTKRMAGIGRSESRRSGA